MAQLEFTVRNQTIHRDDSFVVVAKSQNYLYAHFTFATDDWAEAGSKTAIFEHGGTAYTTLVNADGDCLVPWEVLTDTGEMTVSVFAGDLITVNTAKVYIHKTGYREDSENTEEPTPSIYNQIIQEFDADKEIMIGIRDSVSGYATQVEGYAQSAQESKEAAESAETATSAYAESASQSAEQAQQAASSAEQNAEIVQSAAENIGQTIEDYLDEHPVTVTETDPTVPAWAKEPTKPTYTASDVGAISAATTIIPNGTNLNNLTEHGIYIVESLASANTMYNIPARSAGRLWVTQLTEQGNQIAQFFIRTSVNSVIYYRVMNVSWGEWTSVYNSVPGGIPKTDLAIGVQLSLNKADSALQTAPVSSVNGETGEVVISSLKNPQKLTFTGAVNAEYDGSSALTINIPSGGGGGGGGISFHICTSGEYNAQTGIPTITNPSEDTFYLVPDGSGNDLYTEWIYVNNAWEMFGSASIDLSDYVTDTELSAALSYKANSADLASVATSGSYSDLSNKPTIPDSLSDLTNDTNFITAAQAPVQSVNGQTGTVTLDASDVNALPDSTAIPDESTVSEWGFTKNTGTYSKPSTGIPKTDLASGVQDSLDLADTALQSHQSLIGYATEIWVAQQGFLTQHQDISDLQTKSITDTGGYFTTDTVEGALQEIGAELAGVNALIGTGVIS